MAKVEVEIRKLLNKGKGKGYLTYDEVNDILGLDGTKESVIYISVVGVPAETKQE